MFDDLTMIWAGLLAFAMLAYLVLDGFDLGVGIVFPFLDGPQARLRAMHSLAPIWDGNETWLVLTVGSLLAAFPLAYSILLPALQIPLTLMLLSLVFRGVAFEFVERMGRLHLVWLVGFGAGSLIAALMQGMMLGAVLQGIAVQGRGFAGGAWDWLTPFSALTGIVLVASYAAHGLAWLLFRRVKISRLRRLLIWMVVILVLGLGGIAYRFPSAISLTAWTHRLPLATGLVLLAVIAIALFVIGLKRPRHGLCFVATTLALVVGYVTVIASVFPFLVPPSLDIRAAAAPEASLQFLLVGAVVLLPLILAYTSFTYWVFLRAYRV